MNAPVVWQKSSFSGGEGPNCVELRRRDDVLLIRESDAPGAVLAADRASFAALIAGMKTGEFDHRTG